MGCKQFRMLARGSPGLDAGTTDPVETNGIQLEERPAKSSSSKKARRLYLSPEPFPASPSLENLPVELIYHILDQLDTHTILASLRNVCSRLNSILRTYDQHDLVLKSISMPYFRRVCSAIRADQVRSLTLTDGTTNVGLVELFLENYNLESFSRLRSLTLIDIDSNERMMNIMLAVTDHLHALTIEHSTEDYNDTTMDILTTSIGKSPLKRLNLNMNRNRLEYPTLVWTRECFLTEIKLTGVCHMSLFRAILCSTRHLERFQADDVDFDDEWADYDDEDDEEHVCELPPIVNGSQLISLSLLNASSDMEKLEWFLPQLSQLKSLTYLNVSESRAESTFGTDDSLLAAERWERLLTNCDRFEFIFTFRSDREQPTIRQSVGKFQTSFWQDKHWPIALEQYEHSTLVYSLPYAHHAYCYDRAMFSSVPDNRSLTCQSMINVTKLRIDLSAVNSLDKRVSYREPSH